MRRAAALHAAGNRAGERPELIEALELPARGVDGVAHILQARGRAAPRERVENIQEDARRAARAEGIILRPARRGALPGGRAPFDVAGQLAGIAEDGPLERGGVTVDEHGLRRGGGIGPEPRAHAAEGRKGEREQGEEGRGAPHLSPPSSRASTARAMRSAR